MVRSFFCLDVSRLIITAGLITAQVMIAQISIFIFILTPQDLPRCLQVFGGWMTSLLILVVWISELISCSLGTNSLMSSM